MWITEKPKQISKIVSLKFFLQNSFILVKCLYLKNHFCNKCLNPLVWYYKTFIIKYKFLPKYVIYWTKLLYMYISFNLNNGSFIVVNFLFWNCHIKALDKGDLVLIIFACDQVKINFPVGFSIHPKRIAKLLNPKSFLPSKHEKTIP
jgi:hypothetical protein